MSEEEKKATHFANVEDLISNCKNWIYEEDRDAFYRWFDFGAMEDLINLIEKQNKRIEELERDNKIRNDIGCGLMKELLVNYIPKSVIREKIDEIQKLYEEALKKSDIKEIETMNHNNFKGIQLEGQRMILKELLGGSNE